MDPVVREYLDELRRTTPEAPLEVKQYGGKKRRRRNRSRKRKRGRGRADEQPAVAPAEAPAVIADDSSGPQIQHRVDQRTPSGKKIDLGKLAPMPGNQAPVLPKMAKRRGYVTTQGEAYERGDRRPAIDLPDIGQVRDSEFETGPVQVGGNIGL